MEEEQSEEKPQCGNISCPLGWPLSKTKKKKENTENNCFHNCQQGKQPKCPPTDE